MRLPREVVNRLSATPAKRIVHLLLMAGVPLQEEELTAVGGDEAPAALSALLSGKVLRRQAGRVSLEPDVSDGLRELLGAPSETLWSLLASVVAKTHAGWPRDPALLLLRCRLLTRAQQVPAALDLLDRCRAARLDARLHQLETVLRGMAAADSSCAERALLMLGREHLRRGEVESARNALDEVQVVGDGGESDELRLLRAEALARAGRPRFVLEDLRRAPFASASASGVQLLMAGMSLLAGRLEEARRTLLKLPVETRHDEDLEGRRWATMALSYLLEERFDLCRACTRRARRAYGDPGNMRLEPLLWLIDFLSLLRLDQIDTAAAMAASDHRLDDTDDGSAPMVVRAALLGRQGDLRECLRVASEVEERLDRRADRFLRTMVKRYMARAAIGVGELDRAETLVREVAGAAREAGMSVLEPTCELEYALLAAARGDVPGSASHARRALELAPRNPYVRVEAWALGAASDVPGPGSPPSIRACASLRGAERALQRGNLHEAASRARAASQWYHACGALHDEAAALLSLGEALARLRAWDDSLQALDALQEIAAPLGFVPLIGAASLVRAAIADTRGDLDQYVCELASTVRVSHKSLIGRALVTACARVGFATGASTSQSSAFSPLVDRLGLSRPANRIVTVGPLTFLTDGPSQHGTDLTLDLELEAVRTAGHSWNLAGQPLLCRLLEVLADSGDLGVPCESLYERVWGGQYHPLRHRNTVYSAINRLRRGLADRLGGRQVITQHGGSYRLENVTLAVERAARLPEELGARLTRRAAIAAGPLPEPRQYAERFGLPLGHARWELALAKEQDCDVEVVSHRSLPSRG